MDKIFKERFQNLEKKAPDYILESILDKVGGTAAGASASSQALYLKVALWTAVTVTAIVSTVLLLPNEAIKIPVAEQTINKDITIEKQEINSQATSEPIKIIETNNISKEIAQPEKPNLVSENQESTPSNSNIEPQNTSNTNNKSMLQATDESTNTFKIIAERYTCEGECILKIDQNIQGEWKADKAIFIQDANNSKTLVRYSEQAKVLFTFISEGQKDTFTVFFKQPAELTLQVSPAECGKENGKVEFNFPSDRQYTSTNTNILTGNSISNLTVNSYVFELEDQFSCSYLYKIALPKESLESEIKYDALEKRVDFPIYFSTDINSDNIEYEWNFGDGEFSYEAKPMHNYKVKGNYNVSLKLTKAECTETISSKIEIGERKLEIPNIFTPNNDGKNDVFLVSIPDDITSFKGIILNKEGQLMYQWEDPKEGWDGLMMNGQKALPGTYYYVVRGKDALGKTFEYKSFLELRR